MKKINTNRIETFFINLQYLCLALTILGQITMGIGYIIGQSCFFAANVFTLTRDFVLHRPTPDKVKNCCLTALTLGLILIYIFQTGGLPSVMRKAFGGRQSFLIRDYLPPQRQYTFQTNFNLQI